MRDLISVIVPVYNAERGLHKCIDSILTQTYKNFELILVDDGSSDTSGKICDEYALKYKNIKVMHKNNGGVSSARNAALEIVEGTFITFVDSDDWLENNALEILYSIQQLSNADLVRASYRFIYKKKNIDKVVDYKVFCDDNIAKELFDVYKYTCGMCCNLFKSNIIKGKINFVAIPSGEDTIFNLDYIAECHKIVIAPDIIYNYNRISEDTASQKKYINFDEYRRYFFERAYKIIIRDIDNKKIEQAIISKFAKHLFELIIYHYIMGFKDRSFINKKIYDTFLYYKGYILTEDMDGVLKYSNLLEKGYVFSFVRKWKIMNKDYYRHQLKLLLVKLRIMN